jgi:hypothetical protein
MTTCYGSVDSAKKTAVFFMGLDLNQVEFEEIPCLNCIGLEGLLLDDPDVSEEEKQSIRDRLNSQSGFKIKGPDGKELQIVIGPFREGFELWLVNSNTGMCLRT